MEVQRKAISKELGKQPNEAQVFSKISKIVLDIGLNRTKS